MHVAGDVLHLHNTPPTPLPVIKMYNFEVFLAKNAPVTPAVGVGVTGRSFYRNTGEYLVETGTRSLYNPILLG